MVIKVLGVGCARCEQLESVVRQAVSDIDVNAEIQKVKEIVEIAQSGILTTPGLIINDKIKSQGKLPDVETIKEWIQEAE
ncbi:thioredoxin family protein [candidate division KSB1 bacterium]